MDINKDKCRKTAEELLSFLESSPTSFHAVANIAGELEDAGFRGPV